MFPNYSTYMNEDLICKIRYRLVYNRSGKLNARKEGLIQIECEQLGRKIYFSTRVYVHSNQWQKGLVINNDNADGLNYCLYRQMQGIERIELEYIKRGVTVTLPMLKEAVRTHLAPGAKLMDFGLAVIAESERQNLTKLNYRTLLNNLERFRKGALITDIDYSFIVAYDKWLRGSGIAHNTRVSRLRLLRALVNEARKRDIVHINPFERFRIPQMVAKKGYIKSNQLRMLENMQLQGRSEICRDAFLLGCYTGLRYSDIISLRSEHIIDGWIRKRMKKTGTIVEVPFSLLFGGKVVGLIDKYGGDIGNLTKKIGGNSSINKELKPLFEKVGADSTITFHSSRHTFATLLGQQGIPIQTVQKLMGHTKLQTTEIYSEVDRSTIEKSLRKNIKK